MKLLAIILFVLGIGLLIYSFGMVGSEKAADVSPNEIEEEPAGKWEPVAATVLIIAGIVVYYIAGKREQNTRP